LSALDGLSPHDAVITPRIAAAISATFFASATASPWRDPRQSACTELVNSFRVDRMSQWPRLEAAREIIPATQLSKKGYALPLPLQAASR
jgi:hypothetical protein